VVDILSNIEFSSSKVADAVANAFLACNRPRQAYSQPSVSTEFLCSALKNRSLPAPETEFLVSRKLSPQAVDVFLQRKDKRVGVNEHFLRNNTLNEKQIDVFLSYATPRLTHLLLKRQAACLPYRQFKEACRKSPALALFLPGLVNYKEFKHEDLLEHLKDAVKQNSSARLSRVLAAANVLVVDHPSLLSSLAKFTQIHNYAHAAQLNMGYVRALALASFRSSQEFEKHFEPVKYLLRFVSQDQSERILRACKSIALNPRVSTQDAYKLLDFIEQSSATHLRSHVIRSYRSDTFNRGFDVWYGSFKDLPPTQTRGFLQLLGLQRKLVETLDGSALQFAAVGVPGLSSTDRFWLFANFRSNYEVIVPWILAQTPSSEGELRERLLSWQLSPKPIVKFEPDLSDKDTRWIEFACERLGSDPILWQTFFTLCYEFFYSQKKVVYKDMVLAAEKINAT